MQMYPFLDLQAALADAGRDLADIIATMHALQDDDAGHLPPDVAIYTAFVGAFRTLLKAALPPTLAQAIAEEQAAYDTEADRWEPVNY